MQIEVTFPYVVEEVPVDGGDDGRRQNRYRWFGRTRLEIVEGEGDAAIVLVERGTSYRRDTAYLHLDGAVYRDIRVSQSYLGELKDAFKQTRGFDRRAELLLGLKVKNNAYHGHSDEARPPRPQAGTFFRSRRADALEALRLRFGSFRIVRGKVWQRMGWPVLCVYPSGTAPETCRNSVLPRVELGFLDETGEGGWTEGDFGEQPPDGDFWKGRLLHHRSVDRYVARALLNDCVFHVHEATQALLRAKEFRAAVAKPGRFDANDLPPGPDLSAAAMRSSVANLAWRISQIAPGLAGRHPSMREAFGRFETAGMAGSGALIGPYRSLRASFGSGIEALQAAADPHLANLLGGAARIEARAAARLAEGCGALDPADEAAMDALAAL